MVCVNSKSGKIMIGVLVILTGSLIVLGFMAFMFFSKTSSGDVTLIKYSRLQLSYYEELNSSFRVDNSKIAKIKAKIENFLKPYDLNNTKIFPNCDFIIPPPTDKACGVDIRKFGACNIANDFGLKTGKPCIFMKFLADSTFKPEFYEKDNLPDEMPDYLKKKVESSIRGNSMNSKTVWVSCEGVTDGDKKNVKNIAILPNNGYPGYYFSCSNGDICTSPLVAIQIQDIEKNVEVNIKCRVWAKNANDTVEFKLLKEAY